MIVDSIKAIQGSHIATKVVKQNADVFAEFLFFEFSRFLYIRISEHPSLMKHENTTPVYRKVAIWIKIIIMLVCCIISQKFLKGVKQISNYFENIFLKFQCAFRKGHNAQHYLLALLEK